MRVLIGSGFFESELPSFREYSYSKELAALGHEVTLMCGDQSSIWAKSRVRLPVTVPARCDAQFARLSGVAILRRRVLFRVSDFVLYFPVLAAIKHADVVHVIEFRQGVTLLIALLAKIFGKPVVYDHEQRGDRAARWYSRVDSVFRRFLIFMGSFLIDCMRHTVLVNRDHFRSCSIRRVTEIFAPLGVDPERFYFSAEERAAIRAELQIKNSESVAIMSGKLHAHKRVIDVVKAARRAGQRLILVGTMTPDVQAALQTLGERREILLPQASSERLRSLYCGADIAVFTTFTVSYWEAHATGIRLIVPATAFSELVFANDAYVTGFGDRAMFRVADEQYQDNVDITNAIYDALKRSPAAPRQSRTRFCAKDQCRDLSKLYARLVGVRGGGNATD